MKGVRKLALASAGYCTAVFLAHYLIPRGQLMIAVALSALLLLPAVFLRGRARKRLIILAIAAALGFTHYELHERLTVDACAPYAEREFTVSARVTEYPDERDSCTLLYVKLDDPELPKVKTLIIDYGKSCGSLEPGDEIEASIKLHNAAERYGEETDSNTSKDIYLTGYTSEPIENTGTWEYSFLYFPKNIGNVLHSRIRALFPDDTAPFMTALLAGYKGDYYENDRLYASMSISGLAHVVAVSGMHVAFLVGVLQSIMGKNRRSSLLCMGLVWAFVVMVGSPPSAVRAGIMLSLLLLAPVMGRVNDRTTSLSFAMTLILISNPFAAGSISLQLSFGAMAGIFLFSQPIYEYLSDRISPPAFLAPMVRYALATLSSSLAVTVFTVPLAAVHFGYVTLLAPVVNILCLWAISILFVGGYAVCFIGIVAPALGAGAAAILSYLVRYIAFVVEYTAKLDFVAVYIENPYVPAWLVLTYLLFAAFFVIKRGKRKLSPLLPCALSVILLLGTFWVTRRNMLADKGTISIMDVGNGQCIAVTEGENTVVIDCGSHGIAGNAGNMLSCYLHANGRTDIDYLMLTHLHEDHALGAVRLMNLMNVHTLILPDNAADTDPGGLLDELLLTAGANGTEVMYIVRDTQLEAGEIRLSIYESSERGKRTESGIMSTVSIGDYDMLVTGDVEMSVERELVREHELEDTDLLIVPHHGSKYSTSAELLEGASPETAVISVGYNSYGHPTEEVLERLSEYGVTVLRTDELGRIIIDTTAGD